MPGAADGAVVEGDGQAVVVDLGRGRPKFTEGGDHRINQEHAGANSTCLC